ncbi:hypothetical protein EW145_g1655 [Phellinidium pouzarii]|uniref:non-specific serine/threonine protein kinase n=1 Tax=Phellinidium pouzarii TaxID=167371 RepID=A0A4V3XDJ3_9AGAM|nr:hypothetical protein EW145_g1655 [Phellinidium pouzarii]
MNTTDALSARRLAGEEEPLEISFEDGLGYYPAKLGEDIGFKSGPGPYRIERKLGWGTCSNVWLGLDKRYGDYCALKILTANSTIDLFEEEMNELPFHLAINGGELKFGARKPDLSHPGREHCMQLNEAFLIEHNVEDKKFNHAVCSFEVLDYIHEECGIIHCDLNSENMLLRLGTRGRTREVIDSHLKTTASAFTEEGQPRSQPLPATAIFDTEDIFVKLADFGHGNWKSPPTHYPLGQYSLRAPELILGHIDFGTEIDIWSLGCVVYELLTGNCLFKRAKSSDQRFVDKVQLMHMAGYTKQSIPPYLRDNGVKGERLLDENCYPDGVRAFGMQQNLKDALEYSNIFGNNKDELNRTHAFLRRCLTIDPRRRPSAVELLTDSWLKGD